jgi:hypothetical protein
MIMMKRSKVGNKGKMRKVMGEWKRGTLKSSSGQKVTDKKQALAIAISMSMRKKKHG